MSKTINFEKVGGTALGFVLAGNLDAAKEKIELFFEKTGISNKGKFDYYCFLHKELYKAEEESGKTANEEMHGYLASQVDNYYEDALTFIDKRYIEIEKEIHSLFETYGSKTTLN